jgi:hypothetical protein
LTLSNLSQSTYRKLIQTLKECIISEQKASGRQTSPNLMLTTYKIWQQSFIRTRTNWCGSGWMIINTRGQLYFYRKNSARWHSVRCTIINLVATTKLSKHTSG